MSFYNYRTESDLINGSDRSIRNPWFTKGGSEVVYTPVDDIAIGDYEYFQQHKTLSDGIVFYYECNDGGSGQYEVFDSVSKLRGESLLYPVGFGGANSALPVSEIYKSSGALRGCWVYEHKGHSGMGAPSMPRCHFSDVNFPETFKINNSWSIAIWFKGDPAAAQAEIFGTDTNLITYPNLIAWIVNSAPSEVTIELNGDDGAVHKRRVSKVILDANWHRYVITYNGIGNETDINRMKLYYDGGLDSVANLFEDASSCTDFDVTTDLDFYLGGFGVEATFFGLNQVVIWNRELSVDEVAVDYNSGDGLLWSPQIFSLNPSSIMRHESDYGNFQTGEDRGKHTEMVVAKFNSSRKTERGFLDKESLTFSANNALPWRDLEEREALTTATPYQPPTIPTRDSGFSWLNRTIAH